MPKPLTLQLTKLTPAERERLQQIAAKAGMTVDEWIEYAQKAQIYHNAHEVLFGEKSAA
jgi:hypothetical protein